MHKNPLNQFKDDDGDIFVYLNIFNKLMMDLRTLFESSDVANNSDYNNSNIIENKKKYDFNINADFFTFAPKTNYKIEINKEGFVRADFKLDDITVELFGAAIVE